MLDTALDKGGYNRKVSINSYGDEIRFYVPKYTVRFSGGGSCEEGPIDIMTPLNRTTSLFYRENWVRLQSISGYAKGDWEDGNNPSFSIKLKNYNETFCLYALLCLLQAMNIKS